MKPAELRRKMEIRATETATLILTTEKFQNNHEAIKKQLVEMMKETARDSVEMILDAYGEYTKTSPAYDRMKASLIEMQSS